MLMTYSLYFDDQVHVLRNKQEAWSLAHMTKARVAVICMRVLLSLV